MQSRRCFSHVQLQGSQLRLGLTQFFKPFAQPLCGCLRRSLGGVDSRTTLFDLAFDRFLGRQKLLQSLCGTDVGLGCSFQSQDKVRLCTHEGMSVAEHVLQGF